MARGPEKWSEDEHWDNARWQPFGHEGKGKEKRVRGEENV
jgi:hypothetical protein